MSPNISGYLWEYWGNVFDEGDEIVGGLNDLRHGQVLQNLFGIGDDFPNLRLVEYQKNVRGALQDWSRSTNQLFPAM